MKVRAFSFTTLSTFDNCERQYYERSVSKRFPAEADTKEAVYGRYTHKAFENRLATYPGEPLPEDLLQHEDYLAKIEQKLIKAGSHYWTERNVALDKHQRPCSPTAWDEVFCRMTIDLGWMDEAKVNAACWDYKTGKKKEAWRQLNLNAIYMFQSEPTIERVDTRFYWTQDGSETRRVYGRSEIPILWKEMLPSLNRWVEAHKTDTFVAKKSGLCYGWCPVTDCEHWKPKKAK
jgi:hypothetical protein